MKKPRFLLPLALSVAMLGGSINAQANVASDTQEQEPLDRILKQEPVTLDADFVIEPSKFSTNFAWHYSHRSHSSHSSHYSHRSHYSSYH